MNTSRKLLLAGAALIATTAAASSSSAFAQASATTSATASVTIFQPITITKTADLSFGRVIRPSTGSTVYTVNETTGATSVSGADGVFLAGGGTPTRAAFTVNGEGGQTFSISSDASVTNNGVTINLVKSAATGTLSGSIGAAGSATFGVGGNVTLTNTSSTGLKTGTFNVTVAYQ